MLKGEISGAMDGNCSTCDYPGISNLPVGIQMHVPIEQVFLVCNFFFFYLTNRKRGRCHDVMWNGRNGIVCDDRFTWYNGFAFEANLHAHRPYYSIPTEGRSKAWRQCRGTLSPLMFTWRVNQKGSLREWIFRRYVSRWCRPAKFF